VHDHAAQAAVWAALAVLDPNAAGTHRALAGALATQAALLGRLAPHWEAALAAGPAAAAEAARWQRDAALFAVAGKARAARLERARAATA